MKTKMILLMCVLSVMLISCQKHQIVIRPGGQYVPAAGGTYEIKVKNGDWIQDYGPGGDLEEKRNSKDGTIYVVTTDWLEANFYPKYGNMTLEVSENTSGEERRFYIRFSSGNYFGQFGIRQGAE